jgi:hypothetical protein
MVRELFATFLPPHFTSVSTVRILMHRKRVAKMVSFYGEVVPYKNGGALLKFSSYWTQGSSELGPIAPSRLRGGPHPSRATVATRVTKASGSSQQSKKLPKDAYRIYPIAGFRGVSYS